MNISARDLYSGDIVAHLAQRLHEHEVAPELIQIEITESALMADPARALATTSRIANLGVEVSLDDFGTGYSSLVRLRRLPVGEVKIDASFVRRLLRSADDEVIVRSIIDLVRALGIRSVAEGVETGETAAALRAMGCDAAQGWHFARPLPAAAAGQWLAEHASPRAVAPPLPRRVPVPRPAQAPPGEAAARR
jgi:EAL domain-containing protein (putative c-di-GMP-specific phosphodiesterase class I)